MRRYVLLSFACGLGLIVSSPSPAASTASRLTACQAEPDKDKRLACFEAVASRRRPVEPRRIDPRSPAAFGLIAQKGRPERIREHVQREAEISRLEGVVANTHEGARGQLIIVLADGSVWEQAQGDTTVAFARIGTKVEARHGALGSYFMRMEHGALLRVRRIR